MIWTLVSRKEDMPAANKGFVIAGGPCSVASFMVTENSVPCINFCGKKPAHRKSAKRYAKPFLNNINPFIWVT